MTVDRSAARALRIRAAALRTVGAPGAEAAAARAISATIAALLSLD